MKNGIEGGLFLNNNDIDNVEDRPHNHNNAALYLLSLL